MAEIMAASGLMPKGIDTAPAVFVAVQMGLEVGLSPMQAVQNIAVINGRPSMWGDAVLALVRSSGLLEDFDETIDGETAICTAKRKGQSKPIIRKFSMSDAKQAELSGKSGPWKQYPKRMLQMRARSWALRDGFGDVLKGLHVAEEVMDYSHDVEMHQATSGEYSASMNEREEPPSIDEAFSDHFEGFVVGMGTTLAEIDRFSVAVAEKQKCSVASVKSGAIKDSARFIKAFQKHLAKNKPAENIPPAPPSIPDNSPKKLAPINCKKTDPSHGVFPEECEACDFRKEQGCDEYASYLFDQEQKKANRDGE